MVLPFLSFASLCCFLPLFFVPSVNNVLPSLRWLRGGAGGASSSRLGVATLFRFFFFFPVQRHKPLFFSPPHLLLFVLLYFSSYLSFSLSLSSLSSLSLLFCHFFYFPSLCFLLSVPLFLFFLIYFPPLCFFNLPSVVLVLFLFFSPLKSPIYSLNNSLSLSQTIPCFFLSILFFSVKHSPISFPLSHVCPPVSCFQNISLPQTFLTSVSQTNFPPLSPVPLYFGFSLLFTQNLAPPHVWFLPCINKRQGRAAPYPYYGAG